MPAFAFGVELLAGDAGGFALFEIDYDEDSIKLIYADAPDDALFDAVVRAGVAAGEQMGCVYTEFSALMPQSMMLRLEATGYTKDKKLMDEFFGDCPGCSRG